MKETILFLLIIVTSVVLFVGSLYYFIGIPEETLRQEQTNECISKGGIRLKHTTGTGKHRTYEYICVKEELVIQ